MAGVCAERSPALTELIRSVHLDEGETVLMVEHHMDVVLGLAERVAVMHHGSAARLRHARAVMADDPRAAGLPRGGAVSAAAARRAGICR